MRQTKRKIIRQATSISALLILAGCASAPMEAPSSNAAQSQAPVMPAAVASAPAPVAAPAFDIKWGVYAANALPTAPGAITMADGSPASFKLETGKAAAALASGGVIRFDTSGSKRNQTRYELAGAFASDAKFPKTVTLLARAKADGKLRTTELDMAIPTAADKSSKPVRVKLNIRQAGSSQGSGLQLEKVDGSKTLIHPFVTNDAFHTYQISVNLTSAKTGSVSVYIDGNDQPVLSYATGPLRSGGNGDNYIAFGDTSPGTAFRSDIDFIAWTTDTCAGQACKPSQLQGSLPK